MVSAGRAPRRLLGVIVAAVVVVLVAASCGGSNYHYVSNGDAGAYFKVPSAWTLYRLKADEPSGRPTPIDLGGSEAWHVVFDAAPDPSQDHANATSPDYPVGQALIIPLNSEQADQLTTKELRAFFIGQDPLDLVQQGDKNVELVSFERIADSDVRGTALVMNLRAEDGTWTTFAQRSLVDAKAQRAYLFDVRCRSECFVENRDVIDQIVESYEVRTS